MLGPLQTKWLAELRSGKHQQTRAYLHDSRGYCCLGIATEFVCGIKSELVHGVYFYEGRTSVLPFSVVQKMKFRDRIGSSSDGYALSALNDDYHKTFAEIADIVEANPEHYFTGPA